MEPITIFLIGGIIFAGFLALSFKMIKGAIKGIVIMGVLLAAIGAAAHFGLIDQLPNLGEITAFFIK